ncbi:hypothetical protein LCGC14_2206300 [marine sediment metagenome]|uniref:Uncharacterized protein n=1 Tax=marine sediment metagenome TaxID=412755 RepID=A0A0F9E2K2_9ZZZZ
MTYQGAAISVVYRLPEPRCPTCHLRPCRVLQWDRPRGIDTMVTKVKCRTCDQIYYLGPERRLLLTEDSE